MNFSSTLRKLGYNQVDLVSKDLHLLRFPGKVAMQRWLFRLQITQVCLADWWMGDWVLGHSHACLLSRSLRTASYASCAYHTLACSLTYSALLRSRTPLICPHACSHTPELVGKWMIRWLLIRVFWTIEQPPPVRHGGHEWRESVGVLLPQQLSQIGLDDGRIENHLQDGQRLLLPHFLVQLDGRQLLHAEDGLGRRDGGRTAA